MRLGRMANDFLKLARLESGRASLVLEPVLLDEVIRETLEVLRPQAEKRGVALQVDTPGPMPRVVGDAERLKQALFNLVANGVKFSRPQDRVTVRVRKREQEVVIGVIDTGPGIPPEAQAHLFRKFYRAPGVEDEVEGSGLGMAIDRGLGRIE